MTTIGVLALQGDFAEHVAMVQKLGVKTREVRLPADLEDLSGMIIPGGESTTQARLMDIYGLRKPLKQRVRDGMAIWGTCAGLILMAREVAEDRPDPLGLVDLDVQRNAYGRQVDSFEADLSVSVLPGAPFRAVFIRAPRIQRVGTGVAVLATLPGGDVVAAQDDRMLVSAFHPELTCDTRFHQYFLKIADAR